MEGQLKGYAKGFGMSLTRWGSFTSNELVNLNSKSYYIFGTGVIARRFFSELCRLEKVSAFCGFVVSKKECDSFLERPVYEIDDISEIPEYYIYVAVHESLLDEIEKLFKSKGVKNYYWAYPILIDMELGQPIKTNQWKNVRGLVSKLQNPFPYAIYYVVIDDIVQGNEQGKILYHWLFERGTSRKTAAMRFEKLVEKINEYEQGSYQDFPIKINEEESFVADGAHRLMLALYFNIEEILCDICQFDLERFKDGLVWFFISKVDIESSDLPQSIKDRIYLSVEMFKKLN